MKVDLIIPAAGMGVRFSKDIKKQFFPINGKPVLYYTLLAMSRAYPFSKVIIGGDTQDFKTMEEIYESVGGNIPLVLTQGGKSRAETVYNCLEHVESHLVAVHDAVRPFVSKNHVEEAIQKASSPRACGAICALPVRDTVKEGFDGVINKTIKRDNLYLAHTPQVFKADLLKIGLKTAIDSKLEITDEASAMELTGLKTELASSSPENIKITYVEDKWLMESLVKKYFD